MSGNGSDLIRSHEHHGAEAAGSVVGAERSRRVGRAALPVMNLNMAALIDVVFLLMIYFMLITEFRKPEEMLDVDLPRTIASGAGADPFALPQRPITIGVHSFGDGERQYVLQPDAPALQSAETYDALFEAAQRLRSDALAPDQRFVIQSSPDTRWEHTMGAFNALRRAGFTEIRFARPAIQ